MKKNDLRQLSIPRQEAIRFKVLEALDNGMRKKDAINTFGVSNAVIYKWIEFRRTQKEGWIKQKKRGRRHSQSKMTKYYENHIKQMIIDNFPDDLRLRCYLWTRVAIHKLIWDTIGVDVTLTTIGRYLNSWGITLPKPVFKSKSRDEKVENWLNSHYPAIKKMAKKKNAEIQWGGEMGIKSNRLAATIRTENREALDIIPSIKKFSLSMIYSFNNQGKLQFMLIKGKVTSKVFMEFISRLFNGRTVFLIVEDNAIHRACIVNRRQKQSVGVELFLLQ